MHRAGGNCEGERNGLKMDKGWTREELFERGKDGVVETEKIGNDRRDVQNEKREILSLVNWESG